MSITAALPPYGVLDQPAVQCIAEAAHRYEVPELLLHAIVSKENGRTGQCVRNRNGSQDCGLAQINTAWAPHFARYGIMQHHITHHACTNLTAAAYILKKYQIRKGGDWFKAVVSYNIGPNEWTAKRYPIGHRYAVDVIGRWQRLHSYVVQLHHHLAQQAATAHPPAAQP